MKKLYFYFCLLLTTLSFGQIINFPDANFKAKLLQADVTNTIAQDLNENNLKIDINNNGEIEVSEISNIAHINVSNSNISDLSGIENFTNLYFLDCSYNNLTTLNLIGLTQLVGFNVSHNMISNFQFNSNNLNDQVNLSHNNLSNFTLTPNLNSAYGIYLNHNNLSTLSFSGNIHLNYLYLNNNNLNSIAGTGSLTIDYEGVFDLSFNNFIELDLIGNSINAANSLIITNNPNLKKINGNVISLTINTNSTTFELENHLSFQDSWRACHIEQYGNSYLNFTNCPNLKFIKIKNGNLFRNVMCNYTNALVPNVFFTIGNCPNLNYLCVDEGEQEFIQNRIINLGLENQVQVNTYCSFTPGGTYYTINGTTSTDYNNNNCSTGSLATQNVKYAINDGSTTNYFFGNNSGNYSLPIGAGTYTVTPVLDNPSNFVVNPPSYNVTFPTQSSPFTQNFCIQKNPSVLGFSLDIEMIPLTNAIPGFNSTYRIWFKNTGNITLFGDVELNFNDAVMDYVSSTQNPSTTSTGNIKWNFVLGFLQEGYIDVTFNLNTPTEVPPLNANDILNFTASIVSNAIPYGCGDTFNLNQTVVNSNDPNDKTCLLGSDISPSMIGNYVPYMIRFENTGTFPAQNIVVKDMIDTTKFDITTLQIISSSHPVKTITTGNKIEFIFENINLPFDNANNDGYVAFKIKSLPTLQANDVITNQASIYFDYNFPVETNNATSTYRVLSNDTFSNSNLIKLHPVPTKDILNLTNETNEIITSIEIINSLGQLIQKEIGNRDQINVSSIPTGTYFIKIKTKENNYTKQFIKE